MAANPILIIQMQRLGDLVLTYPLMAWLTRLFPDNPLWVVGEERFFPGLMDFSPPAVFFSHTAADALRKNEYRLVINLSHRPEALELAGSVRAEELIGAYRDAQTGAMFIKGNWQLYRASLVHNNRYNLFHWADMNMLDIVPRHRFLATVWPSPREEAPSSSAQIGLFLGASEKDKHPDAPFWAELADELLQRGHRPVLLGGDAEKPLGREVAAMLKAPSLDLTGHFGIRDLCLFISELNLLVTPDTGPMHLAAWTSTPVLNISTGPVNAWETGPFSPGNHVLRAALPCVGCWHCTQSAVRCKERLNAKRAAFLIHEIAAGDRDGLHRASLPDQELLRTGRTPYGLYALHQITGIVPPRQVTAFFWQAFFGHAFGLLPEQELTTAWRAFREASPGNAPAFIESLLNLSRDVSRHFRNPAASPIRAATFWASFPLPLRPLTSYLHMFLQNNMFSTTAFAATLAHIERLTSLEESAR